MLETWQGNEAILIQMFRYLMQLELAKGFCNVWYFLVGKVIRSSMTMKFLFPQFLQKIVFIYAFDQLLVQDMLGQNKDFFELQQLILNEKISQSHSLFA